VRGTGEEGLTLTEIDTAHLPQGSASGGPVAKDGAGGEVDHAQLILLLVRANCQELSRGMQSHRGDLGGEVHHILDLDWTRCRSGGGREEVIDRHHARLATHSEELLEGG
jgi:hypothetical protein